jgi:hypothetical protein
MADLGKSDLYSEEMFIVLEDILKILNLQKLKAKSLIRMKLLTSEGVFLFLFKKLKEQNTDLSNELLTLENIC